MVGLDLSVRTFPNGSPLRDKAHLALLERFRGRLSPKLSVRAEVPLPISGDLRAWDLVILRAGEPIGVEAETRLLDLQAIERKIALKMRDGRIDRVVLLVSAQEATGSWFAKPRTRSTPRSPSPGGSRSRPWPKAGILAEAQ